MGQECPYLGGLQRMEPNTFWKMHGDSMRGFH